MPDQHRSIENFSVIHRTNVVLGYSNVTKKHVSNMTDFQFLAIKYALATLLFLRLEGEGVLCSSSKKSFVFSFGNATGVKFPFAAAACL